MQQERQQSHLQNQMNPSQQQLMQGNGLFQNLQGAYPNNHGLIQQPRSMSFQSYQEAIAAELPQYSVAQTKLVQQRRLQQSSCSHGTLSQPTIVISKNVKSQPDNNNELVIVIGAIISTQQKMMEYAQLHQSHQMMPIIPQPQHKEYLTVTVIPLESHFKPYEMIVEINPETDKNLKQVFANSKYWQPVFANHSPILPPHFRVFKTPVSTFEHKYPYFKGLKLQILSLKCEGYQFPKNPNALPIEQFCVQHFFGPLVIALQTETAPPQLKNFLPHFLENLRSINEEQGKNYPPPPIPSILNNPSFLPSIALGAVQNFEKVEIHSLTQGKFDLLQMTTTLQKSCQEIIYEPFQRRLEVYLKNIDPIIFYIYRYKTTFCANKSKDHDWNQCVFAHKPFDYRRPPDKIFYLPEKCKNYNPDTGLGCKEECQFSHTTFERLYHPNQYKTNPCQIFKQKKKNCQKGELCAFVHFDIELRHIPSCDKMMLFDKMKKSHQAQSSLLYIQDIVIPELPYMTEEELKQLQRITEQQLTSKSDSIYQQVDVSQQLTFTQVSQLNSVQQQQQQDHLEQLTRLELASLSLKSKAFTPSYKKAQSCSEPNNNHNLIDVDINQKQILELDIDQISLDNIGYHQQPLSQNPLKSPSRLQSSSQTNLNNFSPSLIESQSQDFSCKQKNSHFLRKALLNEVDDDDQCQDDSREMIEVLMKNNQHFMIKPHEDSQTRTSSRFQHMFDKVNSSENQSRKWTENSNQPSYEDDNEDTHEVNIAGNPKSQQDMNADEEDSSSQLDVFQRDIFSMNIESIDINYLKDLSHSDC
eukprot:403357804